MTTKPKQFKATILIVEDHTPTLTAVQALLSAAFPACRLLAADSGERALELCTSDTPQVVVMDIALPGIDGIEATRRSKSLLPDTRVVMHSSHDLDIYRDAAAAAGASAFVAKSRTFSDLVPAITALLSPAPLGIGGGRQSGNPPG
jgi:DNA-binding NarL/FixJ family response regulator